MTTTSIWRDSLRRTPPSDTVLSRSEGLVHAEGAQRARHLSGRWPDGGRRSTVARWTRARAAPVYTPKLDQTQEMVKFSPLSLYFIHSHSIFVFFQAEHLTEEQIAGKQQFVSGCYHDVMFSYFPQYFHIHFAYPITFPFSNHEHRFVVKFSQPGSHVVLQALYIRNQHLWMYTIWSCYNVSNFITYFFPGPDFT